MFKNLTEAQKGYIAGIIDGEGTIYLTRKRQTNGNYYYHCTLLVTNTNYNLLIWLSEITNVGKIHKRKQSKKNHKIPYVWRLSINEMVDFLKLIQAYLIIKIKQADLMLEYINECTITENNKQISIDIEIKRELIYEEMRDLNKRGLQ